MSEIRALILGDVIGQPGCRALFIGLQNLKKEHAPDIIIVNGENAADGYGITPEIADKFMAQGVDVITTGNHVWQKREILDYMDKHPQVLRPENYPGKPQGHGYYITEIKGHSLAVVNLQGREQMGNVDCPFRKASELTRKQLSGIKNILIDFHGEIPMEKEAFAKHLDGKVTMVWGTHTHIQTNDERILPNGTGYITDIGSTGVKDSVIGFDPKIAIERSLSQMPLRQEVLDGNATIHGILVKIDPDNGRTLEITKVQETSSL
ncbi:TIGR00282 family metallophosphoesterase [Spirochaeta cellobiosiphila]|uniref:TIGR00282 family metallophosphoesterase n=1 Tax=Spirochaeta cellobiosiphila TaxID=504483 RepID=UPI000423D86B|nr:TIGR00282 family metallophosphoesterase [Spirochaeta cellobiosiphila]